VPPTDSTHYRAGSAFASNLGPTEDGTERFSIVTLSDCGLSWFGLHFLCADQTRRTNMTTSSTHTHHNADNDSFLPIIASAWKEGELSDLELAAVCLEIIQDPNLDLSCRETLQRWLDSSDGQATIRSHTPDDRLATAN
jgi:hypothetical protein